MSASLDLEVTRRCNLRCDYCFVGWSRGWTHELPVQTALQIIEEGAGRFPQLHLTGGEPFAYKHLFTLLEAGVRLGYPELLVNTNGTLLGPETSRRLATYGDRLSLSLSLDGPPELHDASRGAGRYQQAVQGLKNVLREGVRVTVMTVVTPSVLKVLAPFIQRLGEEHAGLAGFTLFPVGVGPGGSQKPGALLQPLSPEELRELALTVALLYRMGINIGVAAYPIINPLLKRLGYPASRLYQCTAGRGRVAVHADLSVSSCHPVKEPIYGTWQPGLFSRLSDFPGHHRLARRDFDGCRTCALKEECGHCRAFVTGAGAPLYGNDRICQEILPLKDGEFET